MIIFLDKLLEDLEAISKDPDISSKIVTFKLNIKSPTNDSDPENEEIPNKFSSLFESTIQEIAEDINGPDMYTEFFVYQYKSRRPSFKATEYRHIVENFAHFPKGGYAEQYEFIKYIGSVLSAFGYILMEYPVERVLDELIARIQKTDLP